MRWERLFEDLEGQWDAGDAEHRHIEAAERIRAERAGIDLSSRLWAARSTDIAVTLVTSETVRGTLNDAAHTWILLGADHRNVLIPIHAVARVSGLGPQADTDSTVVRKLTWGYAMRVLSRDRSVVTVETLAGQLSGLIGAVGEDYIEVIDPQRPAQSSAIAMSAIVYVAGPW